MVAGFILWLFLNAAMVESVDTRDLKSLDQKWLCGFKSHSRYDMGKLIKHRNCPFLFRNPGNLLRGKAGKPPGNKGISQGMKQTKIVASISDRRCDVAFLQSLYDAGINVVRINTAHATEE